MGAGKFGVSDTETEAWRWSEYGIAMAEGKESIKKQEKMGHMGEPKARAGFPGVAAY